MTRHEAADSIHLHQKAAAACAQHSPLDSLNALLKLSSSLLAAPVASLRGMEVDGAFAGKLIHYGCLGYGESWVKRTYSIDLNNDESITVQCFLHSREPILTKDNVRLETVRKIFPEWTNALHLGSGLYARISMGSDQKPIGTVALFRQEVNPFTNKDIEAIQVLLPYFGLALSRAMDFSKLKRTESNQAAFRDALSNLALSLRDTDDVSTFLRRAVRFVQRLLNVHVATAFLYEDSRLRRKAIYSPLTGLDDDWFSDEEYIPGQGITGSVFMNDRPSRGLNIHHHPSISLPHLARYQEILDPHGGPNSQLIVPMHGQGGKPIGVLRALNKLAGRTVTPVGFSDDDLHLMEMLSSAIGIAVDSLRLLGHAQARVDYLEHLQRTIDDLSTLRIGSDQFLKRLVDSHKFPGADYMDIVLVESENPEGDVQLKTSVSGIPGIPPLHVRARPLQSGGHTRTAISSRLPVIVPDVDKPRERERFSPYVISMGIKSYAVIPLLDNDRGHAIGAVVLYSKKSNRFDSLRQDLDKYAHTIARALARSYLMSDSTLISNGSNEAQANAREQELDLPRQLAIVERSTPDVRARRHRLIRTFTSYIASLFDAQDCSLYVLSENNKTLLWVGSSRVPFEQLQPYAMLVKDVPYLKCGLTVHVAKTARALCFTDTNYIQHTAWLGTASDHLESLSISDIASLMITPIQDASGATVGVLKLENKNNGQSGAMFTEADADNASTVGASAIGVLLATQREVQLKEDYEQGIEIERARFKTEIHAGMQVYQKAVLQIESVIDHLTSGQIAEAQTKAATARDTIISGTDELRLIVRGSGDLILPLEGLQAAIFNYVQQITRPDGDRCVTVRTKPSSERLTPKVEAAFWHVFRNAIGNALKHSGVINSSTGWIWIDLDIFPDNAPDTVVLRVEDNGAGFDPADLSHDRGLEDMHAAAAAVGAVVDIKPVPGTGTLVEMTYIDRLRSLR